MKAQTNYVNFKYLTGEATFPGKKFDNMMIPDANVDGNYLCVNSKYLAFPMKQGGGAPIAIQNAKEFTKF